MRKIKSSLAICLVICLLFSFTACGKDKTDDTTTTTYENAQAYAPDTTIYNNTTQEIVTEAQTQASTEAPTQAPTTTETPTEPPTEAPTEAPQVLTGVGKYTASYAGVEQAVFYPNSITANAETLPVIAWANGTGFSYTIYENLIKEIAEGGYIVVANTETMSADGSAQISSLDFVISENNNSSSVIYGKVNTSKLAVAGHSQGGRSSVNTAAKDSRIVCALSLAGSNFVEEAEKLSAPTLFFAGAKDMIVSAERWIVPAYNACKGPAVYVNLKNGIHTTCSTSPQTYSGYAVKWFDAWLKNDSSAKAVFRNGGELSSDSAWQDFQCKGI